MFFPLSSSSSSYFTKCWHSEVCSSRVYFNTLSHWVRSLLLTHSLSEFQFDTIADEARNLPLNSCLIFNEFAFYVLRYRTLFYAKGERERAKGNIFLKQNRLDRQIDGIPHAQRTKFVCSWMNKVIIHRKGKNSGQKRSFINLFSWTFSGRMANLAVVLCLFVLL